MQSFIENFHKYNHRCCGSNKVKPLKIQINFSGSHLCWTVGYIYYYEADTHTHTHSYLVTVYVCVTHLYNMINCGTKTMQWFWNKLELIYKYITSVLNIIENYRRSFKYFSVPIMILYSIWEICYLIVELDNLNLGRSLVSQLLALHLQYRNEGAFSVLIKSSWT